MQQALANKKEGDRDAVSCSTDTSRWSTPSRLRHGSNTSHDSFDFEDQADLLKDKSREAESADMGQGAKPSQKAQEPRGQKTNYTASRQVLKLPPIKFQQVSKPRIQSDNFSCIRELRSQVWDLQLQLNEARTENKLLKRVQHRHMVALQHFQDSECSLSQILTKHNNEVRVLQGLLRETRACRDNLARQLQATENKLLGTKASLQRLQLLSQDHSLLEREELTFRLTKATAEMEEKDKRILVLEKNVELCQASFNRQIVTEQKKINEARNVSCFLQEQIHHLNREIQDRERELETHNIYSHRFQKGSAKKGRESKMVQTDGLVLLTAEDVSLAELKTEERLEEQELSVDLCGSGPVQEFLAIENTERELPANVTLEKNQEENQEDTATCAYTSEQSRSSEESLEHQTEGECEEEEASEASWVLGEWKTEESESEVSYIAEQSLNTTEPKRKGYKPPKLRRIYTFKQSTENLHRGRPAYSSVGLKLRESTNSPVRVETLSCGNRELRLPAEKFRRDGVGSPQ